MSILRLLAVLYEAAWDFEFAWGSTGGEDGEMHAMDDPTGFPPKP